MRHEKNAAIRARLALGRPGPRRARSAPQGGYKAVRGEESRVPGGAPRLLERYFAQNNSYHSKEARIELLKTLKNMF